MMTREMPMRENNFIGDYYSNSGTVGYFGMINHGQQATFLPDVVSHNEHQNNDLTCIWDNENMALNEMGNTRPSFIDLDAPLDSLEARLLAQAQERQGAFEWGQLAESRKIETCQPVMVQTEQPIDQEDQAEHFECGRIPTGHTIMSKHALELRFEAELLMVQEEHDKVQANQAKTVKTSQAIGYRYKPYRARGSRPTMEKAKVRTEVQIQPKQPVLTKSSREKLRKEKDLHDVECRVQKQLATKEYKVYRAIQNQVARQTKNYQAPQAPSLLAKMLTSVSDQTEAEEIRVSPGRDYAIQTAYRAWNQEKVDSRARILARAHAETQARIVARAGAQAKAEIEAIWAKARLNLAYREAVADNAQVLA